MPSREDVQGRGAPDRDGHAVAVNEGTNESAREVERVARTATGRLTALLASRCGGDLTLAEDAVSEALVAALSQWPERGVPREPEAWLFTVAKRAVRAVHRRDDVRRRHEAALTAFTELENSTMLDEPTFPDERLGLLFACAHPAIDKGVRAALMLQTVFGLSALEIGALYATPAKTMGQRLWRAKNKIKVAKIPFEVPDAARLPERVPAVLDAIYGVYTHGYVNAIDDATAPLAREALWLAQVAAALLPSEPEALGLHALLLYVAARDGARDPDRFVPLSDQDTARWDAEQIGQADAHLRAAGEISVTRRERAIGPFQLEAAIQSALVHGLRRGEVDRAAVVTLYDALVSLQPTLGVHVGRAAALLAANREEEADEALRVIAGRAQAFQPYWAVRAAVYAARGSAEAKAAYGRAIELARDPRVAVFLAERETLVAD